MRAKCHALSMSNVMEYASEASVMKTMRSTTKAGSSRAHWFLISVRGGGWVRGRDGREAEEGGGWSARGGVVDARAGVVWK